MLKGLLQSVGVEARAADAVVDAILGLNPSTDWRDADGLRRLNGAEAEDYARAGLAWGPCNGPFEGLDEVEQVLGVTRELAARLHPALTLHSRRSFVDPATAPAEVLRALLGMDQSKVEDIVRARVEAGRGFAAASPIGMTPLAEIAGRAFTVTARAQVGKAVVARTAVVRLTGDSRRPYLVHELR